MNNKTFKTRSFYSIGMLLFFTLLFISGLGLFIVDYQSPTFLLLCFKSVHVSFGMGFIVFSIAHIGKNWKSIKAYIGSGAKKTISKEMLIGLTITIIVLIISMIKAIDMAYEHGIPF